MKTLLTLMVCFFVVSCANQAGGVKSSTYKNNLKQAEEDFKQGRIMQSRQRLLKVNSGHADYAKAQVFLKKTVEPARQRLLRYHQKKAVKAERKGQWFIAAQRYQQVAILSEKKSDVKKITLMQERLRGQRAKVLARQLKYEDIQWQRWLKKYRPSHRDFDANDAMFALFRNNVREAIEYRVKQQSKQAKALMKKMPELAYILLQSSQRLAADAVDDLTLTQLKKRIPTNTAQIMHATKKRAARATKQAFSMAYIQKLIEQQQWLKARTFSQALKKQGKKGRALLKTLQDELKKASKTWFDQGRQAFSTEQVDEAVRFWHKAVEFMPSNKEYNDALQRALQVQERLHLIRGQ